MYKSIHLFLLSFFCLSLCHSIEKYENIVDSKKQITRELLLPDESQKAKEVHTKYSFSSIIKEPKKFETFIINMLSIIDIESPQSIQEAIKNSSENLFIHSYLKTTPFLSEFIFQLIKSPKSLSKFLEIGIKTDKLFIFFLILFLSMILSHCLGEFKYKFSALSFKRISYSLIRFTSVNSLRVAVFGILFFDHIKPVSDIYISSLHSVKALYPLSFQVSRFLHHLI